MKRIITAALTTILTASSAFAIPGQEERLEMEAEEVHRIVAKVRKAVNKPEQKKEDIYTVKKGDNPTKICKDVYGTDNSQFIAAFIKYTKINPTGLQIDQEITAPELSEIERLINKKTYNLNKEENTVEVLPGFSVGSFVKDHYEKFSWPHIDKIYEINGLKKSHIFHPGEKLKVMKKGYKLKPKEDVYLSERV